MIVKGIVFDINGTLSDICTNEWHEDVYRIISNILSYQGIMLGSKVVKDLYFRIMKEQRAAHDERHREFDAVGIFREIIAQHSTDFTRALSTEKREQLPTFLAEAHRAASRFRLQLYPGVAETIRQLHANYRLAIVSDGQTAYAVPELNAVGLADFFDPIIVSGSLHVYVSQTARGELVMGASLDPYELHATRPTLDFVEGLTSHMLDMFPFLSEVKVNRQWAGLADMTPDFAPIMGVTPVEGFFLDAGWGTWGFKATPVCGKTMSHTVATGRNHPLIEGFTFDRFAHYRLTGEKGAASVGH